MPFFISLVKNSDFNLRSQLNQADHPQAKDNIPKIEDLEVEVYRRKAWFKATVTDVSVGGVSVAFEGNCRPESRFAFAQVRLPMEKPTRRIIAKFEEGQEVEVKCKIHDEEARGWRRAVLSTPDVDENEQQLKPHLKFVIYLDEPFGAEAVNVRHVRTKNTNSPIDDATFTKVEHNVPENFNFEKRLEAAEAVKRMVGAASCRYLEDKGVMLAISRRNNVREMVNDMSRV